MDIKGKIAIVTGGANGIGKCLVEKLMKEGADVGVFDNDENGLNKLKSEYIRIYCNRCDLSNSDDVEKAVNDFYDKFKNIDILVNNAGIVYNSPLITLSAEGVKKHSIDMWRKVIDTDLSSVFYMTVNVVEKMISNRTKGVIINVSSVCAAGNAGQSAYSAAKAGINALTATWTKELSPMGIRVAAVAPGYAETQTMKQAMSESVLKEWTRRIPIRRFGKQEEIADGICFIIKNDFYNGKVLELDGGLII